MTPPAAPFAVREIPLHLVDDPELPSRSEMDDAKMAQLVESIRANGILQNLVLVERGDRFEVVAGHRRTVAAKLAGLVVVPARVYPPDHASLRVIQAHENGRREDVNAVDEAVWFAELLERDCGQDVERLAGHVGESVNYVLGRLELLELDPETLAALKAGQISIGVAKALRKCGAPDYRHYFLTHAIRGGAKTATVEAWIQDWKRNIVEPAEAAPAAAVTTVTTAIASTYDPMRCYVCGRSDHRMTETVNVHGSCREAILDPMLHDAANPQP